MGMIDGMDLGQFGIWTGEFEAQQASATRESVQELDELGWRAVWFPEADGGREALTHAGFRAGRHCWRMPTRVAICSASASGMRVPGPSRWRP
ncbi:MAG: hypothetical protein QOG57_2825 [Pseudonocardiales bacterium]|jgi:alkylation response protein AidB-like acyl-CoA dehydrogenase|nr:hypothetical protein [Pseudonocardiales bacterium]